MLMMHRVEREKIVEKELAITNHMSVAFVIFSKFITSGAEKESSIGSIHFTLAKKLTGKKHIYELFERAANILCKLGTHVTC